MIRLECGCKEEMDAARHALNGICKSVNFVSVNGVSFHQIRDIDIVSHEDKCILSITLKCGDYATVKFDAESQCLAASTIYSQTAVMLITIEGKPGLI